MALKLKGDTQSLQAVATGAQGYQTYNDIKGATCRLQTPGKGEKSVVGHILLGDISLIDLKKKFDKQFLKSDLSMLKGEDFFIEDFFEVAEELNIFYRELDISKSENFYVQVFEKYFRKPLTLNNSELWQELKKRQRVHIYLWELLKWNGFLSFVILKNKIYIYFLIFITVKKYLILKILMICQEFLKIHIILISILLVKIFYLLGVKRKRFLERVQLKNG